MNGTVSIVVAVKDRAIDAFSKPMHVPTANFALRSFRQEVNNPESPMYKNPEDFDLYELARFDDRTGVFNNCDQPRLVARAQDLKES